MSQGRLGEHHGKLQQRTTSENRRRRRRPDRSLLHHFSNPGARLHLHGKSFEIGTVALHMQHIFSDMLFLRSVFFSVTHHQNPAWERICQNCALPMTNFGSSVFGHGKSSVLANYSPSRRPSHCAVVVVVASHHASRTSTSNQSTLVFAEKML